MCTLNLSAPPPQEKEYMEDQRTLKVESGIVKQLNKRQPKIGKNMKKYISLPLHGLEMPKKTEMLSETLYHRDDALLYIAYVMLIWAALSLLTGGTAVCGHS